MVWAQWTLLVMLGLSTLLTVYGIAVRLRGPVLKPRASPAEAVVITVLSALTCALYVCAGAFSNIFGWPK